jgi:glycosyltransferase involved in cell wall biosynthesis
MLDVSVIICTHNPRADYLRRVLEGLRSQELALDEWELLLVDNASDTKLSESWDITWHPNARHVREERLGLTYARLAGFRASVGPVLVYIDDDNVPHRDYLRIAKKALDEDRSLGACGGKVIAEFETVPPPWLKQITVNLGCQDLGDEPILFSWVGLEQIERAVPHGSPCGAGLVLRREAFSYYVDAVAKDDSRLRFGRKGDSLASCEDNDIVITTMHQGYKSAYLPQLVIKHLIPSRRIKPGYLASLGYQSMRTWALLHYVHGLKNHPPPVLPWSVPARKVVAFLRQRAWRAWPNFIRWRQLCGQLEGRAEVRRIIRKKYEAHL